MKVTVLGSGAAGGVPMISRGWGKCDPDNPRNRRRRPSILVEEGRVRILVDTGPDLREQLLEAGVSSLDAVLYTHGHADHLHGIDDLREVNRAMGRPLDVYGEEHALADIRARFGYVFEPLDLATQPIYKPLLVPHLVEGSFEIGPMNIVPMVQDHGYGPSTGFRFGDFAYSTDVVEMPAASFAALSGIKVWMIGCLVDFPHQTHAHVDKALAWIERIRPQHAYLTHLSPQLDYETLKVKLPKHVEPAYDGLVIEI